MTSYSRPVRKLSTLEGFQSASLITDCGSLFHSFAVCGKKGITYAKVFSVRVG